MNTQRCRVQMMRAYFGEPEGDKCGLCDSCAGLDSEVFDPGSADVRHGLHAATDFHARPRRRRRGRGGEVRIEAREGKGAQPHGARPPQPYVPPAPVFETAIPGDILPPLAAAEVPPPLESEARFDEGIWNEAAGAGAWLAGDAVVNPDDAWFREDAPASASPAISNGVHSAADEAALAADAVAPDGAEPAPAEATPPAPPNFDGDWAAVRDAEHPALRRVARGPAGRVAGHSRH